MSPVNEAGESAFRKDVQFVTKDDEEQVAAGIVMVPDKVDLQQDFAREGTIREFAEQFGNFAEVGEAGGGVMHAVWPEEWMALERNEVLDEATELGGQEVQAGAWIQEWRFEHADLWELVADDVLSGYSIGAIDVRWDGPFEQDADAVDDVDTSEAREDEPVWELISGIVREVSAVDIPAVPDAQILETKSGAEKRLSDHLGNRDGFIEEALERGHSEVEAERLWDVLNEAADVEGAGEPGKQSMFARIGKAAVNAFTGADGGSDPDTPAEDPERAAAKEGRTLSTSNQHSLMATIDASLDVLQDAGVDHGMTRFTDRDETAFDLSEHSARTWEDDEDEEEDGEEENGKDASGGDTPGDGGTEAADDMTNDDDTEPPEWAKELQEQLTEQSKRIDDLAGDGGDDDGDKDANDDPMDDAPEWAKALKEDVDEQAERIDTISQQSGYSDQLEASAGGEENDDEDGLDAVGKALS